MVMVTLALPELGLVTVTGIGRLGVFTTVTGADVGPAA